MTALNTKLHHADEELRSHITAIQVETGIIQEELGDEWGVTQTQVNHWLSFGGTQKLPAAAIRIISSPKLHPLKLEIVRFICATSNIDVMVKSQFLRKTNGRIDDEATDLVRELGMLIQQLQKDPAKRAAVNRTMENIQICVQALRQEVSTIEEAT